MLLILCEKYLESLESWKATSESTDWIAGFRLPDWIAGFCPKARRMIAGLPVDFAMDDGASYFFHPAGPAGAAPLNSILNAFLPYEKTITDRL